MKTYSLLIGILLVLLLQEAKVAAVGLSAAVEQTKEETIAIFQKVEQRSDALVERWNAPECQNYYGAGFFATQEDVAACGMSGADPLVCPAVGWAARWGPLPWKGPEKRKHAMPCMLGSKSGYTGRTVDVVVSEKHRFVYVSVVKSASSTIRENLWALFRAAFDYPDLPNRRLTTHELDVDELKAKGYFVWSFIRDPMERLPSQLRQARLMNKNLQEGIWNESDASILEAKASGCFSDSHMATQAYRIGGGDLYGRPLRYDFLGRVENFDEDFSYVVSRINQPYTDRWEPIPASTTFQAAAEFRRWTPRRVGPKLVKEEQVECDDTCWKIIEQDFVCFSEHIHAKNALN